MHIRTYKCVHLSTENLNKSQKKPNANIVFINNFTFGEFGGCNRKELLWIGRLRGKENNFN